MAKPNYSFEKRQRELAKRKKKEGKLAERAARKSGGPGDEMTPNEAALIAAGVDPAAPAPTPPTDAPASGTPA
jgi:hypothetical protein